MGKMVYIESKDGNLFRGYGRGNPVERWDDNGRQFVKYEGGPKPEGWGDVIDAARALELMNV